MHTHKKYNIKQQLCYVLPVYKWAYQTTQRFAKEIMTACAHFLLIFFCAFLIYNKIS